MTEVVQAIAGKAVVAEPPKVEAAPAVGPEAEALTAERPEESALQPCKRGRPRKAESEGKVEKKTPAETGKRQKSLFDF